MHLFRDSKKCQTEQKKHSFTIKKSIRIFANFGEYFSGSDIEIESSNVTNIRLSQTISAKMAITLAEKSRFCRIIRIFALWHTYC